MEMRLISRTVCFILFLLLTVLLNVKGRSLAHSSVELLVSDGINNVQENQSSILALKGMDSSSEEKCEQLYGFLPCSSNIFGHLFLIAVYEYMLFHGEGYLASGGEKIFRILGPGVFGASAFQVLGALPESLILLASGLLNTREVAQESVSTGVGLLAGTSILLLTLLWGTCVIAGKFGVTTDLETSYTSRIMGLSVIPFLILQVPKIFNSNSGEHLTILTSLVVSVVSLLIYFFYQIFEPWIQKRRLEYVKYDEALLRILQLVQERALGRILTGEGAPNINAIQRLFRTIDENGDDRLSASELKALVIGIRFEEIDFDKDDAVSKLMKDFDTSNDNYIDETEFSNGIQKWHDKAMRVGGGSPDPGPRTHKYLDNFHDKTKKAHALLRPQEPEEGQSDEGVKNPRWTSFKASLMLLAGAVIAAAFADPLVDAVDNFSDATSIPTFFISFIALPLATNSSEAVSAIIFASRKKVTTASLTFSELYGAVTMNNVLCLAVFLALVYFRELTWDFSAEVLVICIVCVVMGAFASFRTTFPLWTSFLAFFLYPFSLVLVYVLDYVLGWS
uniref:EF-hand domain-containing protein n=1 Tax=Populus alba TaxID=43335 RepID=A0A4U5PY54_POPAL|nr:hypothetical protein D5086_0000167540 [Populus alba]